jgi:hypothetical protein
MEREALAAHCAIVAKGSLQENNCKKEACFSWDFFPPPTGALYKSGRGITLADAKPASRARPHRSSITRSIAGTAYRPMLLQKSGAPEFSISAVAHTTENESRDPFEP